jgi:PAS domain S-box-containing protein
MKHMRHHNPAVVQSLSLIGVFALALVWVFAVQPYVWPESVISLWARIVEVAAIVIISMAVLIIPHFDTSSRIARRQKIEDYLRGARDIASTSESALVEALNTIPEGFVVYDADGRLVRCNKKFREIYGYSEAETAPGVSQEVLGALDEQRGVRVAGDPGGGFLAERMKYRAQFVGEQIVETPNGRLISTRERPLERGGFVSIQTDITELNETQERLRKSEQLLLDAIEGLDEGFIFYDEDDRLVVANSTYKEMYPAQADIKPGITFTGAIKLSVYGGEVPAAIGREEEWLAERIKQHLQPGSHSEQVLSDGRWVKVSERRMIGGGVVGIRTDITALKESQSQAEAANRAKTSFLAHMSHELRTPLNSIIGYSDMIRQETFGAIEQPKYAEYLENIYNSGALLLSLINDVLDTSRVEIGEVEAFPERVNPLEVISSCINMMNPKAESKDITLWVEQPPFGVDLFVDTRHLQQIIINLLGNSIKFTADGGKVCVYLNDLGETGVEIKVNDNGCGIISSEIPNVFKPFSQVGDAFSKSNEGTGLGLYLVKNLAELNGASIKLESEYNVGTTVSILFPQPFCHLRVD